MSKNYGLKKFADYLIYLISISQKELIKKVEEEARNNNLVTYICEKYKTKLAGLGEIPNMYDIESLNKYFSMKANFLFTANSSVPFINMNEDDGLLALVAVILQNYSEQDEDWNKDGYKELE